MLLSRLITPRFPQLSSILSLSKSRTLATMSQPKILLLGEITHAKKEWSALSSLGELITPKSTNREDFINEAKGGAFDGTIAAFRTFHSIAITGRIDAELVAALPSGLRFLCHSKFPLRTCDSAALRSEGNE